MCLSIYIVEPIMYGLITLTEHEMTQTLIINYDTHLSKGLSTNSKETIVFGKKLKIKKVLRMGTNYKVI